MIFTPPSLGRRPAGAHAFLAFILCLGLITGFVSLLPTAAIGDEPGVSVAGLEVENRTEPLGIDIDKPRFSWITSSESRDVIQESYRLRVATSEAGLDDADVWDSGIVSSQESSGVEYGGGPLQPTTTYYWRVDITTNAGASTSGSSFATGMFEETDWAGSQWIGRERVQQAGGLTFANAKWIWTPEAGAPVAPAEDRAFRKVLATPQGKTAAKAEILITADDSYKLWVNGELLGQTAGANNEWQGSKKFIVDLNASANVIAVRTTNGPGSPAGLLMVVKTIYTDGSSETITTDGTWKAAKQIVEGFEAPGFDDSTWPAAAVQATYGSGPWGRGVNLPTDPSSAAPLLRKEITLDRPVAAAKLYVAAGGYANVSLNGAPINDELLSPGFTDYDDHAQYTVTDVSEQLQTGVNALGMELGRGFYGMTNPNVWNWHKAPWHDEPVTKAVLRVEYTDGTVDTIVTDGTWTLHDGPTLLDDLYGGEIYDARKVQTGWDTPGFADDNWVSASVVEGPGGTLVNQSQQPIRITESIPAESMTEPVPGVYVVKFPRVVAGNVRFTVQGEAGEAVRAQYGEKLLANGRPDFSNNGGFQSGFQTDRFILAGTGEPETWAAKFSYKGFQYIEVTEWPGEGAPPLSAFTAEVLHSDTPETGSFESSSEVMNKTHRAVVDTLLNNLHSIPTDTPMFEKNGWTGDASVGAEMFLMNLDSHNLFAKWIGDVNDTRDENGAPLVIAPSSANWGQWGVNPSWHSAYVLIPWQLYQYGGDKRVLTQYYDGMKAYVDVEFNRSPGGIANASLGDWVSPEASPAGGNPPEDTKVSATAYLYTMLLSMEKSANLLDKPEDAAAFAAKAQVVKTAFNARFYDAAGGYYRGSGDRGYRQTHNALALSFGLAPDDATAERVAASLAADVEAKGNKLNTGTLGTKELLPVLTEYGYEELAYKVAVQTEYPSWGYMIENGATTMWEHWSLEARSRGHYFLGTVDDWFYHDVLGINSSETTGYREITIRPGVTDQLEWAKGTTQTQFGPVSVDWSTSGDKLGLRTHVPVGSTATVHLPATNSWAVTEGGQYLDSVDGVRSVEQDGDTVLVTIGSGDYSFEVNEAAAGVGAVLDLIGALRAEIDRQHAEAGALTKKDHDALTRELDRADETARRALAMIGEGSGDRAAQELAGTLKTADRIDRSVDRLKASAAVVAVLQDKANALRQGIDAAITDLLGVTVTVERDQPSYLPGQDGMVRVELTNGGTEPLQKVEAVLTGLDAAWKAAAGTTEIAKDLPAGESVSADLQFTVPADQEPGEVQAVVGYSYRFHGETVRIAAPTTITVGSAINVTNVVLEPADVAPGGSTTLTATVRNSGTQPGTGRLAVVLPEGWQLPTPANDVLIPAGGEVTVSIPLAVPLGADQAREEFEITANFVRGEFVLGSGSAVLVVSLAPVPDPLTGYDYADLGVAASEQAHRLTASASSGTNTEAGLTRRYAGHLRDFSYFEFDMKVVPGRPFLIRATETYDRPQTKKYKIYIDGVEATERVFSHVGGTGTETFEFLADASFAADDIIRIKFETQNDHSFYDPSIADVWTLPLAR